MDFEELKKCIAALKKYYPKAIFMHRTVRNGVDRNFRNPADNSHLFDPGPLTGIYGIRIVVRNVLRYKNGDWIESWVPIYDYEKLDLFTDEDAWYCVVPYSKLEFMDSNKTVVARFDDDPRKPRPMKYEMDDPLETNKWKNNWRWLI